MQLSRRSRAAIIAAALACFSGAFALAPLSARSAANQLSPFDAPVSTAPLLGPVSVISPRRDPFAGAPDNAIAASPSAQTMPQIPAGIGGLPSNLTGMIPLVPGAGATAGRFEPARIAAVVTGANPYALVVENNETVIKAVGDKIDGSTIVGITMDGVMLEGGHLRRVTSSLLLQSVAAPAPLAPQTLATPTPVPQPSPTPLGSSL